MANAKCRRCRRAADAGAYYRWCAASIMAKALDPFIGGRRNMLSRPKQPRTSAPSAQHRLFR